jgi:hypothetical protein
MYVKGEKRGKVVRDLQVYLYVMGGGKYNFSGGRGGDTVFGRIETPAVDWIKVE